MLKCSLDRANSIYKVHMGIMIWCYSYEINYKNNEKKTCKNNKYLINKNKFIFVNIIQK